MTEEEIIIPCGDLNLEGLLDKQPGDQGVVVTHPHPLYGGEMNNSVVWAVIQTYREKGYSTLRFNFRGVGKSEGSYSDGIGEQEDVRAALRFMVELGKKPVDLVGYSFGAWVSALVLESFEDVGRLLMVSPPVGLLDFEPLGRNPKVRLVIGGSLDDIAVAKAIEEAIKTWNPDARLRIIEDADHFYGGKTLEVKKIVQDFLDEE
jgi:alpha/beta superfamily hydrolase